MNGNRLFTLKTVALSLSAALLLAWPSASEAGPIVTFNFEGEVTELDVNAGIFGPPASVALGDVFSGHFSYELGPTNPDQQAADPTVGVYNALEFVVDQSVLPPLTNVRIGVFHDPALPSIDPISSTGVDRFLLLADAPGSVYATGVRLVLEAPFGTVFSDDSLPANLDLSQFTFNTLGAIVAFGIVPAPTVDDRGTLTLLAAPPPAIPEPSTLALSLLALGGILARRGCRKDRR